MTDFIIQHFVKDHEHTEQAQVRERYGKVAGAVGIVTNTILFLLKFTVGSLFGSVSVMADAINNLSDSASSLVTIVGFKLAGKPADEKHPFGHARIEYLSGVIVSFIIIIIGWQLGQTSIQKILNPSPVDFTLVVFVSLLLSMGVKLWQCGFYRKVGKKISSEAIVATSSDSRNDVISTGAVLIAALVTRFTNVNLDGYMGLAVAVFIIVSGVKLVMDTGTPLLGEAPGSELVTKIGTKILSYQGILGLHDLTIHNYGAGKCFASVHCEVSASEDIMVSHDIIDNIERDFLKEDGIHLVIHLDPIVTDDERTNHLRAQVNALIAAVYPEITTHDFRVVWGLTHSNVVFDISVPFSEKKSDKELTSSIRALVETLDESYRAVVTLDRTP